MLNVVQLFEASEASDGDKGGNHADMKMYLHVKNVTKTMDKSTRTNVSYVFVDTCCAGTILIKVDVDHA